MKSKEINSLYASILKSSGKLFFYRLDRKKDKKFKI